MYLYACILHLGLSQSKKRSLVTLQGKSLYFLVVIVEARKSRKGRYYIVSDSDLAKAAKHELLLKQGKQATSSFHLRQSSTFK